MMDIYASKLEVEEDDAMSENDALHSPTTDTTVVLPLDKSPPALSITEVTDASADRDTTESSVAEDEEARSENGGGQETNGTAVGSPHAMASKNATIANSKVELQDKQPPEPQQTQTQTQTPPPAPAHETTTTTLRAPGPVRRNHSLQNRQSKYMEEPDDASSPPIASPLPARASFDTARPLERTRLARNDTLNRQSKIMLEEGGPMPPAHDPLGMGRSSLDGWMHPQNTLRRHPLSASPSILSSSPWQRAPSTMSSPSHMGPMGEKAPTASRYNRASYSLTNQPDALKVYRAMAEKTGDPMVQFTYAKYLLEVAALYEEGDPKKNKSKKERGTTTADGMTELGRASSLSLSRTSLHSLTHKTPSRSPTPHALTAPSESQRRKKKMFEDEGVRWIKRLTKEGMGAAAFLQAQWMDTERYGFKKNQSKARKLYQLAAKADIPEALYIVAQFDEAAGFLDHAFSRYQKAAIQAYPPALLVSAADP